MAEVSRWVGVSPTKVWAVLADGWSYPLWVVCATHMRDVDADWPALGSRIHHSVGVWPLMLQDDTEVVEMEADRWLELRARGLADGRGAGADRSDLTDTRARNPAGRPAHVRRWGAELPTNPRPGGEQGIAGGLGEPGWFIPLDVT